VLGKEAFAPDGRCPASGGRGGSGRRSAAGLRRKRCGSEGG